MLAACEGKHWYIISDSHVSFRDSEGSQIVIVCVKVKNINVNGVQMVVEEQLQEMRAIYVCAVAAKGNMVNTPWQWIPFQ